MKDMKDLNLNLIAAFATAVEGAKTTADIEAAAATMDRDDMALIADYAIIFCKVKEPPIEPPALLLELSKATQEQKQRKATDAKAKAAADVILAQAQAISTGIEKGVSVTDEKSRTGLAEAINQISTNTTTLQSVIAGKTERGRFATYADIVNDIQKHEPEKDFTSSLFAGLRCPNGTVNIIAARPGGGKTSAMINLTREVLLKSDRAAFFVNLEMNRRQIFTNLCLSIMYDIADNSAKKELDQIRDTIIEFNKSIKRPKDTSSIFTIFQNKAMSELEKAMASKNTRLFIYDGIGNTLESITTDIASKVKEGDVILLDYIQLLPPPGNTLSQTRQIQIQQISHALMNTAITTQCVLVMGAQLGRQVETEKREATQADLRESGDLETDAHNIVAIESIGENPGYIHVLKAREAGDNIGRIKLETAIRYVYWTGTEKYEKPSAQTPNKKPDKAKKVKNDTPTTITREDIKDLL